jgi:DNA primase
VAPIKDVDGTTLAYVGRAIGGVKPKYKVTEESKCGGSPREFLYGVEKVSETGTVLVCEGPGDAWALGAGAIATLGTGWKREQASQLARYPRRVIVFDPDRSGEEKGAQLAEWLSVFPGETTIVSGLPSDPGTLKVDDVRHLRKEAGV